MTNATGLARYKGQKMATDKENPDVVRNPMFVESVKKGFDVLHAFNGAAGPLSLTEIAERSNMGKSSAQRFCHTLIELGFLERDNSSKRMKLTTRLLEFSYNYLASERIIQLATQSLITAHNACGQSINLALPIDQDVIYVARLHGSNAHLINPHIGGRAPMYCTSSGRAYLSTLPDDQVKHILDASALTPVTRHTVTDRSEILRRIEEVSEQGFTSANQECINGELSIGAPIHGPGGVGIGAINICVTIPAWTLERLTNDLAPLLCQTAHDISLALSR